MVFFGADFVTDVYKQTSCTEKYGKKIDINTKLGLLSIGFLLLIDCFLRMASEIALGALCQHEVCFLPSNLIANDFIVNDSACLSVRPVCCAVSNIVQDKI